MFKNGNTANEIYRSMEQNLVSSQVENQYGFDKLARAIDYLNTAASIFEAAGMHEQADEIAEVLRELAK